MTLLMAEILGVWVLALLLGVPLFASMGLAAFAFVAFGGLSMRCQTGSAGFPRRCPLRISGGCWRFRTAARRWGLATMPYSWCCLGWVCALVRSPGCAGTTSTGGRRR